MPSSNPRWRNHKARAQALADVRRRAWNGEPCGICGLPIDMARPQWYVDPSDGKRKRAPWSCECDEIVPISLGGLPYGDNVQPAHRACNQRKGNGMRRRDETLSLEGATSREW